MFCKQPVLQLSPAALIIHKEGIFMKRQEKKITDFPEAFHDLQAKLQIKTFLERCIKNFKRVPSSPIILVEREDNLDTW